MKSKKNIVTPSTLLLKIWEIFKNVFLCTVCLFALGLFAFIVFTGLLEIDELFKKPILDILMTILVPLLFLFPLTIIAQEVKRMSLVLKAHFFDLYFNKKIILNGRIIEGVNKQSNLKDKFLSKIKRTNKLTMVVESIMDNMQLLNKNSNRITEHFFSKNLLLSNHFELPYQHDIFDDDKVKVWVWFHSGEVIKVQKIS